ncbi:redoxin domain-containing protein [Buchnera aphidicola (Formosaphis micheliae)]|uniref:peroxiredoxin n=1 Tax=Buchnera aphidicola TaxID=9 RepID=UPI0031B7F835
MTLVTKPAPDFTTSAVLHNDTIIENFNLYKTIHNKKCILFFWPMDFTFVCPSEIIAFNQLYSEFLKRDTEIIGVSCDSVFVHYAWRQTSIKKGGIGNIQYTIVSDIKREIQKIYEIEHPSIGVALRASFLIDKNKIIRHQVINDLPFGRNINELLRMIDAVQFNDIHGEVCPAQWTQGKDAIKPSPNGILDYCSKNRDYSK